MNAKHFWTAIAVLTASLLLWGCDNDNNVYHPGPDDDPPGVPRGVASVTGDEQVTIVWLGSTEEDLRAYIVYRDADGDGEFGEIGRITVNEFRSQWSFVDHDVNNGNTYDYAVSAVDYDGNESDLSYEDVFDTPRPEGFNVTVNALADLSGFDFSEHRRVNYSSPAADVIFTYDSDLDALFIEAADINVDVQDFGFTESLDDLDWAPEDGWSWLGWSELIVGHTYVVWTADNHFAKVRVKQIDGTNITFDWAYQTVQGLPELKPAVPDSMRASRTPRPRGTR